MSEKCEIEKRLKELEKSYSYLQEENIRLTGTQYKDVTVKLDMPWWFRFCMKIVDGKLYQILQKGVITVWVRERRFETRGGP